jgi:hypothetical protein
MNLAIFKTSPYQNASFYGGPFSLYLSQVLVNKKKSFIREDIKSFIYIWTEWLWFDTLGGFIERAWRKEQKLEQKEVLLLLENTV